MKVCADSVRVEAGPSTDLRNLPAEAALAVADIEDDPPGPGLEDTGPDCPPLLVQNTAALPRPLTEGVSVDIARAEGLQHLLQAEAGVGVVNHQGDGSLSGRYQGLPQQPKGGS